MDSRPDMYGEDNEAQDADQESGDEVEVVLSQWPVVKTEYGSKYEEEDSEDTQPMAGSQKRTRKRGGL